MERESNHKTDACVLAKLNLADVASNTVAYILQGDATVVTMFAQFFGVVLFMLLPFISARTKWLAIRTDVIHGHDCNGMAWQPVLQRSLMDGLSDLSSFQSARLLC